MFSPRLFDALEESRVRSDDARRRRAATRGAPMRAHDVAGASWCDVDTLGTRRRRNAAGRGARTGVRRANVIRWGALAVGVILFAAALYYINLSLAVGTIRRLGARRSRCSSADSGTCRARSPGRGFPQPRRVSFLRLARVRLAAEASSYPDAAGHRGRTAQSRPVERSGRSARSDRGGRPRARLT